MDTNLKSKGATREISDRLVPYLEVLAAPALDEVIKAIKAAPNLGKLDVRGSMGLTEPLLKLNTLTFDDQAVLILENLDADFIAIAANELLLDIRNPAYRAYISRPVGQLEIDIVSALRGGDGGPGANGQDGQGESNRQGLPGGHGLDGGNGLPGRTRPLPPVFFFIQKLSFGKLGKPSRQYLYLNFQGLPGGSGGTGGNGGNGGKGSNGKEGADSAFDCREGPGRGGDGGNAGRGGKGGTGGTGGNGGSLYLFAPSADLFDFSTANIEGGVPGRPGDGGDPGSNGRPGLGGPRNGWCGSGPRGNPGAFPTPATYGPGDSALAGRRGIQIPHTRDNRDLF
ncbi:hypothetical protein [Achromobacter animicus]|uniref:hypothetical protein n=1 Tax=Achromobacter animicus TaxID=1389935 RepID=UPI0028B07E81|nr:hypothetical protein [Achromobacter animicus]